MPLYEYRCPAHGKFDGWANMGDRHQPQACSKCGVMAPFTISAPRVFGDYEGYVSPASGKWIEGKKARQQDFAVTDTRPYESGEMEIAQANKKLVEAREEAAIDAAVETTMTEILNG